MIAALHRIRTTAIYWSLRLACAVRGHNDGQHFRKVFANGDALLADEEPWCNRCGTDRSER